MPPKKRNPAWDRILNPPKMDHAGSPEEWRAQADALLSGKGDPISEALAFFGFQAVPDKKALKRIYRARQKEVHPDVGGDTDLSVEASRHYEVLEGIATSNEGLDIPNVPFMLAEPGDVHEVGLLAADPNTGFQRKLDGARCKAVLHKGEITLVGRGKHKDASMNVQIQGKWYTKFNDAFPDVVDAFKAFYESHPGVDAVFDGELVCFDERGIAQFNLLQHRVNRQEDVFEAATKYPAYFVVFDVVRLQGEDIAALPLRERWLRARSILDGESVMARVRLEPLSLNSDDKMRLWQEILRNKEEGVMVKDLNSPYDGVRSAAWRKLKRTETVDLVVIRWLEGTGRRKGSRVNKDGVDISLVDESGRPVVGFGALKCAAYRNGVLVEVADVGGGFKDSELRDIRREYLGPDGTMKKQLVIEVEYFGITKKDGRLRMPQFLRVRDDKVPEECLVP